MLKHHLKWIYNFYWTYSGIFGRQCRKIAYCIQHLFQRHCQEEEIVILLPQVILKKMFFFPPSVGSCFIKMTSPKSGTRIFFLKTTQIYSINENSNSQQNLFLLVTEACRHSLPNQLPTDRHMLGDLQGSHSAPTPVLEVPDLIPRYFLLWVEVLLILLLVLVFNQTLFVQRKSG